MIRVYPLDRNLVFDWDETSYTLRVEADTPEEIRGLADDWELFEAYDTQYIRRWQVSGGDEYSFGIKIEWDKNYSLTPNETKFQLSFRQDVYVFEFNWRQECKFEMLVLNDKRERIETPIVMEDYVGGDYYFYLSWNDTNYRLYGVRNGGNCITDVWVEDELEGLALIGFAYNGNDTTNVITEWLHFVLDNPTSQEDCDFHLPIRFERISFIDVGLHVYNVPYQGDTRLFKAKYANIENNWEIQNNAAWVHVGDSDFTKNPAEFTLTIDKNQEGVERTATVTVSGTGINGKACSSEVVITQERGAGVIVSPETINIPFRTDGERYNADISFVDIQEGTLGFYTNVSWIYSLEFDDEDSPNEIRFKVEDNTDFKSRQGVITIGGTTIDGKTEYAYLTIIQEKAKEEGKITINPQIMVVDFDAGTVEFDISKIDVSGEIEIVSYDNWALPEIVGDKLRVAYMVNPTTTDRSFTITLSAREDVYGHTITASCTLTQNGKHSIGQINLDRDIWETDSEPDKTTITLSTQNIDVSTLAYRCDDLWIDVSFYPYSNIIYLSVPQLDGSIDRTTTVYIYGYDTVGFLVETQILVTQFGQRDVTEFPIWMDIDYAIESIDHTTNRYIDYEFRNDGNVIFTGRAFVNGEKPIIRVNEILRDHLPSYLNLSKVGFTTQFWQNTSSYIKIDLYVRGENERSFKKEHTFRTFNNYTYDINRSSQHFLTEPITKKVDNRQYIICSVMNTFNDNPYTCRMEIAMSNTPPYRVVSYDRTVSNEISTIVMPATAYTITISDNADNKTTYKPERTNYSYAVYYLNKLGGYSWCLFNRASKQTDTFTYSKIKTRVNNQTLDHSKKIYQNDFVEKWVLKSDYLTDKQADRMTELLGSPQIWLHDLEKNRVLPCIVTDTTCEHLKWQNNGKHRARFNVTVENSQDRLRR